MCGEASANVSFLFTWHCVPLLAMFQMILDLWLQLREYTYFLLVTKSALPSFIFRYGNLPRLILTSWD